MAAAAVVAGAGYLGIVATRPAGDFARDLGHHLRGEVREIVDGLHPERRRRTRQRLERLRRVRHEAGPVVAFRGWRVLILADPGGGWSPILRAAVAGNHWPTPNQVAVCDGKLREGPAHPRRAAPLATCTCGIHGAVDEDTGRMWGYSGWPPIGASGRVELVDAIVEDEIYRAQRARIVGPLTVRIGCSVDGCVRRGGFVVTHHGTPEPYCAPHVVAPTDADRVELVAEFRPDLFARLRRRYGVHIVAG